MARASEPELTESSERPPMAERTAVSTCEVRLGLAPETTTLWTAKRLELRSAR